MKEFVLNMVPRRKLAVIEDAIIKPGKEEFVLNMVLKRKLVVI